ncbi:HNH endonuclease [Mycolicibacterium obuense]|uniref:HNH endonuclease n=1 Tax=Mycolicibacterium obuense TaxID=1807 RepID=A0A4R5X3D6_9MYCO|nr:HNH endonuclease signature motif containing protein [Mycolicibacterium obuense]TDL04667.1 HNH endonuclease [Mycolicibacterium obuense]
MSPISSLAIDERLSVLHEELAELTGQRNAIDARIVEIAAEIDRDELWAAAGAKSTAGWVAWKAGLSPSRAQTIAAIARRYDEFPSCVEGLKRGRFSVDQVGVIAEHGLPGSDEHFATMAQCATVTQLRTALKMQPKPTPEPQPQPDEDEPAPVTDPGPQPSITSRSDEQYTYWQIALPHMENAAFESALASHRDALITEWKAADPDGRAPMPNTAAAFLRLVDASWDAEAAARPHAQRTTVVVHVDVASRVTALHLGPVLPEHDRRYLTCDATCEAWFHRDGQVIGAGRSTRTVNRRLRRTLEYRDCCCVVPGCGATRALHAHHLVHWEDGGPTELWNLALVCPYHHRAHHRGLITITGPADQLVVTDAAGRALTSAPLARTPTEPPPDVAPCPGPTGERAQWWWYQPYEPPAPG